jgi:hypothetical protein
MSIVVADPNNRSAKFFYRAHCLSRECRTRTSPGNYPIDFSTLIRIDFLNIDQAQSELKQIVERANDVRFSYFALLSLTELPRPAEWDEASKESKDESGGDKGTWGAEYRVIETDTGKTHLFDYRSEAKSFYDAIVSERGDICGYEFVAVLEKHQPPEILN